ncbi:SDR family oxidoreductase [Roseateles albus]|uniref:dTDP-4-dehydrorhamnose reductase n=1 Tax=Roseateles albus TaxID=2987525 RepID=A0ABT5KFM9_9BURK|nr:sugar nucleotide-binding protein [Roseateles albus]MDC8772738.1 sugar nucleotide-binding protein [Roseateles albus]
MTQRIALCGSGGLLGSEFRSALSKDLRGFMQLPRACIEDADVEVITAILREAKISIVINCIAHTNLEAAEVDPSLDKFVNSTIPGALAKACSSLNILLVHFSSTGCYGHWKDDPYIESDQLVPPTQHHLAKYRGEMLVRSSGCRHLIIRTGWLFGGSIDQPKNFVWKRILEASQSTDIISDNSQRGCPTYVGDVVAQSLAMLSEEISGTFNVVAHGSASRYEYVAAIISFAGLSCKVKPGPGFKRQAPVSMNEMAVNFELQQQGMDLMTHWRTPLRRYILGLPLSLVQ